MVKYRDAKKYEGKMVHCSCHGGQTHVGKVHKVTKEGIWLDRSAACLTVGDTDSLNVMNADQQGDLNAEPVFFPLLFLPFVALLALAAFRRPYGYGYGYPGYGYGPYAARRRGFRRGFRY